MKQTDNKRRRVARWLMGSGIVTVVLAVAITALLLWWPYYIERQEYSQALDQYRYSKIYCTSSGSPLFTCVTHYVDGPIRSVVLRENLFEMRAGRWQIVNDDRHIPDELYAVLSFWDWHQHQKAVVTLLDGLIQAEHRDEAITWARRSVSSPNATPQLEGILRAAGFPYGGFETKAEFEAWWDGPVDIRLPGSDEPLYFSSSGRDCLNTLWNRQQAVQSNGD
ncbi:MAG: hypothetical protein GC159_15075 [Phycisphaera sp.]|nr:hypothetical protein [Phycisphaera sp.]